jgi:flagellar FliL protein
MAEEQAAAPVPGSDGEKKKGGAPMMAILGAFMLVVLLALGGFFFMMQSQAKAMQEALAEARKGAPTTPAPPEKTQGEACYYDLDEFLVNLANPGGGRYLRATLSFRFHNEALREAIKKEQPQIRDAAIAVLTSRTTEELASEDGKEKLKKDLIAHIAKILPDAGVDGVFIQSFTIQ